jgi:hypothetical protein
MRPLIVALVSLALMFGAAVAAIRVRPRLPDHHLSGDAKDVVTRGIGFVVTLAALVLGLLIASGKSSHDEVSGKLRLLATQFVLVDRNMAHYGADAAAVRDLLRRTMVTVTNTVWPDVETSGPRLERESPREAIDRAQLMIRQLVPNTDAQRALQTETLHEMNEIKRTGWLLIELMQTGVPTTLVVVIVVWLVIVFFGFGLFAPRNHTVNVALFFSAFCAACAIFLILELYAPVKGLLAISPRAFQISLEQLGR